MVIYLDQYRAAPVRIQKNGTYGDEIMNEIRKVSANAAVVYLFHPVARRAISPDLPENLFAVDIDGFLSRIYALATQI